MSANWMRHFELQILDKDGKGISLSDFKVKFQIQCADTKWPRVANVTVYNLSPTTSNKLIGKEFSKIRIIAGYDGIAPDADANQAGATRTISDAEQKDIGAQNYGLIFEGDIRFTVTGKDNVTDSWVQIQALDGHEAFIHARTMTTIAAGYTVADLFNCTMKGFNELGVSQGITGEMPTTVFPRGRVMYDASRNVMDNIAKQCGATWQIVDGQVQMVPEDKYIHEAVVLNANTGLIGMPQQTMGAGVNVRCLINPSIRVNGLIQLDQASVYRAALGNSDVAQSPARIGTSEVNGNIESDTLPSKAQAASIATDGVYIVKAIDYTGDTRGQAWYMDLMCFARGARDLQTTSSINRAAG
jgi:hypothetical protein